MKKFLLVLSSFLLVFGVISNASADTVVYYGDSSYEIVTNIYTWQDAKYEAEKLGGYLATITTQDEWNAITSLDGFSGDLWLGGYQLASQNSPSTGWKWVTGEDFVWADYEAWTKSDEPNDYPDWRENNQENYLETYAYTTGWCCSSSTTILINDTGDCRQGFIMEKSASVPEPATMLLRFRLIRSCRFKA